MHNILTLNNIAKIGLDKFGSDYYASNDSKNPEAILLRSHNLYDFEIPSSVQVIARAGAGTNNVPVEKMTTLGIPVLNTPGANANAVKELVITGMLLACRNICPAWEYACNVEGSNEEITKQVENNKKNFSGFELPGRTLGIIGLGNIGVKVANAARYLGMNVIGFDPAVTVESAWQLRSSVQQATSVDEVIAQADFISIHVPYNEHTKNLIDAKEFAAMKKGATLLNFARSGIINNDALMKALNAEKIHRYVCDFPSNEFKANPKVICLPHLGASTIEAEENCAVMAANQIKLFLESGEIKNSVNFPNVKMPKTSGIRIAIVNRNIPNMVAQITSKLSEENINIIDMINKSRGEIAYTLIDTESIDKKVLEMIEKIDGVIRARFI